MDTACLLPPGFNAGIQKESSREGDLQGEELAIYKHAMTDPGGYCVAYSMYIADQRLANPKMRPEEVYLKAIQDASGQSYSKIRSDYTNARYKRERISFIRQYARTYLEVLHDIMDIYSEYILLERKKWKDLTNVEKKIRNQLYTRILVNLKEKLLKHSG